MADRRASGPRPCAERGFALVTVLWVAGLLAVMSASLAYSVRTNVRVTANIIESEKAEALADAGIALAILDLTTGPRSGTGARRFPVGGGGTGCVIAGEGTIHITIDDEAGKVDVNAAGLPILQALLVGLGEEPGAAAQLAGAILDFRDPDDQRAPGGAESADYRSAGLGWGPKNAPFQSVDELGQVRGMTSDRLAKLRPYVGLHAGLPGIDAVYASGALVDLLRKGLQGGAAALGDFSAFDTFLTLPAIFLSSSSKRFLALRAEAHTLSGAAFIRETTVDLGTGQPDGYKFLSWRRSRTVHRNDTPSLAGLAGC